MKEWEKLYGEMPKSFEDRVESTLAGLETKKAGRGPARRLIVAAVSLAVLVGVGAAAAGIRWGIGDFIAQFGGVRPSENVYMTDLGSADNGKFRLSVREAVYDGHTVRAVVEVVPVDADRYVLYSSMEGCGGRIGGEKAADLAERTGRELADIGFVDLETFAPDGTVTAVVSGWGCEKREGENIVFYSETHAGGAACDAIRVCAMTGRSEELVRVDFELPAVEENAAREMAWDDTDISPVVPEKVEREETVFGTYIRCVYRVEAADTAGEDGVCYAAEAGVLYHIDPSCGGMEGAAAMTAAEAAAMGKRPCPVCTEVGGPTDVWRVSVLDADGNEAEVLRYDQMYFEKGLMEAEILVTEADEEMQLLFRDGSGRVCGPIRVTMTGK